MRSLTRTACMLAALGTVAGAPGCVELDETPTYASEESKSRLAGFTKDLGDELNAFWGEQWGEGWKPARIKVPKRAADTACGTIDADNSGRNDAAVAAVVGHEFGHHLQTLSGIEEVVDQATEENPEVANLSSVAYELNADCLMGIWMSSVADETRLE
ncbi:MAG: neutral zinc metallopeptidase, partial [Solirubrobacterales bacterium]